MNIHPLVAPALGALLLASALATAHAAGMTPETSVVLVDAAAGEGFMNVTNTDPVPSLLFSSLAKLPEDEADLLIITPPVTRVEAGETQRVRFLLSTTEALTTQRLQRVTFEGIAHKAAGEQSQIALGVRHNLPVLIHPKGLAKKDDPWTLLHWSITGSTLTVRNDSPYVVRLSPELDLLPGAARLTLPTTYVLPGMHHALDLPATALGSDRVRFYPAGTYGYQGAQYEAPVSR